MTRTRARWTWMLSVAVGLLGAGLALAGKPGGGGGGGSVAEIAYTQYVSNWQVRTMAADGTGQTVVVSDPLHTTNADPSWSPTVDAYGQYEIVYVAKDALGPALWVTSADGQRRRVVVPGDQFALVGAPRWSPVPAADGRYKILFETSLDGKSGGKLHLVNTDGTGRQMLTPQGEARSDTEPSWSPDATHIAFGTSGTTLLPRGIAVARLAYDAGTGTFALADGTTITDGTPFEGQGIGSVDWARASNRVLFTLPDPVTDPTKDPKYDLYTLSFSITPVDGGPSEIIEPTTWTRITSTPDVHERTPSWSPDDAKIVFWRTGYGAESKRSGLYVIRADGTGLASLNAKDGRSPDWRR